MKKYEINYKFFELSSISLEKLNSLLKELTYKKLLKIVILKIGPFNFRLVTNDEVLLNLSKKNFYKSDNENFDATIYSILNVDLKLIKSKTLSYKRLYNESSKVILHINCYKYEFFKMSYRTLCSELGLIKYVTPLHSANLYIKDKMVIILGQSGAGKTTLMTELLNCDKSIKFIWDDWGFYNFKEKKIISSDEYHSYLKTKNIYLYCRDVFLRENREEIEKNNRLMVNLSDFKFNLTNSINKKIFSVIILTPTNYKEIHSVELTAGLELLKTPFYNSFLNQDVFYFNGSIPKRKEHKYNSLYKNFLDDALKIIHVENNYTKFNVEDILKRLTFK